MHVGHGSMDSKVSPKAAQGLYHKLSKSRRPGTETMKVYARSGHGLAEQATDVTRDVMEWVDRVLQLTDSDL